MLNSLKKYLNSEKKNREIVDIIIYGSFVKGKDNINDIDILVIFLEGRLKERLDKIQKIKSRLKKIDNKINFDVKAVLLKELFSPAFFARTGIFLEGISIFNDKNFSETFGFKSYSLFWYNLNGLNHNQKVKFNYILAGRGMKGVIESLEGFRLANGVVKIPIKNSAIFEDILKDNKVNYLKKNILEEI